MLVVLSWFVQCLLILLSVAFFTLFERKLIGLFHLRLGPNKISFIGLLQPLLDAFKLLSKQGVVPLRSNKFTYSASPIIALFLSLFIWLTIPTIFSLISFPYSLVIFFCVGSIIVFSVLLGGWSSNSKYSLMGSLRSIAQSISYEAVFSTIIVVVSLYIYSYSIVSYSNTFSFVNFNLLPIWIICTLAETHRAPFDFSESESELVSGFNTEYSGLNFALVFLSEYAVLLYSCILMSVLFFYFISHSVFFLVFLTMLFSFFFVWVRITFCRFRYDNLIYASWNILLPVVLMLFLFLVSVLLF